MRHITHGLMGRKYICNEQHDHFGPSQVVHLYRHGLPKLLSQCEHFMTFEYA
jgi:hypothetical protein